MTDIEILLSFVPLQTQTRSTPLPVPEYFPGFICVLGNRCQFSVLLLFLKALRHDRNDSLSTDRSMSEWVLSL